MFWMVWKYSHNQHFTPSHKTVTRFSNLQLIQLYPFSNIFIPLSNLQLIQLFITILCIGTYNVTSNREWIDTGKKCLSEYISRNIINSSICLYDKLLRVYCPYSRNFTNQLTSLDEKEENYFISNLIFVSWKIWTDLCQKSQCLLTTFKWFGNGQLN